MKRTSFHTPNNEALTGRFCVMCKHFSMSGGHVYSTYTADGPEVGCDKGHWRLWSLAVDGEFRECQRKAQTCKDYDDAE